MYEFEVSRNRIRETALPDGILKQFEESVDCVERVCPIKWEEHCTECTMPYCYSNCDFYEARKDGHCRRFLNGFVPLTPQKATSSFLVRVDFKSWGEMIGVCNNNAMPIKDYLNNEKETYRIDQIISYIPDGRLKIAGRKGLSARLRKRAKNREFKRLSERYPFSPPDAFLLEIYNPQDNPVLLSIAIRRDGQHHIPFLKMQEILAGYNRVVFQYDDIVKITGEGTGWSIILNPNLSSNAEQSCGLVFGLVGFVHVLKKQVGAFSKKPVKIAVWDLDNTMWEGVLVEDGMAGIRLNKTSVDVVKELDRRGIVNSIVSKNAMHDGMAALERFGIKDYFVYPQIGWEPKPHYIGKLIRSFNVHEDSFAFIDDSQFEREHVNSVFPGVRTYDAAEISEISGYPEFNPVVTDEAKDRRAYYQAQVTRESAEEHYTGKYEEFLKSCDIKLQILTNLSSLVSRINELVQRTNQLNFTGHRYTKEEIQLLLEDQDCDCFALRCKDRYGHYGVVGFCIVDLRIQCITDLMFSCRIQGKRIEHAFICWLIQHYKDKLSYENIYANCLKTERNAKGLEVFKDLKFEEEKKEDGHFIYSLSCETIPNVESIISIYEE